MNALPWNNSLLNEATSSLDSMSEQYIQESFEKFSKIEQQSSLLIDYQRFKTWIELLL